MGSREAQRGREDQQGYWWMSLDRRIFPGGCSLSILSSANCNKKFCNRKGRILSRPLPDGGTEKFLLQPMVTIQHECSICLSSPLFCQPPVTSVIELFQSSSRILISAGTVGPCYSLEWHPPTQSEADPSDSMSHHTQYGESRWNHTPYKSPVPHSEYLQWLLFKHTCLHAVMSSHVL